MYRSLFGGEWCIGAAENKVWCGSGGECEAVKWQKVRQEK